MSFLDDILTFTFDFLCIGHHWRFYLSLFIGICAGVLCFRTLELGIIGTVAGVISILAGGIYGLVWESRSSGNR